eukprot:CAMPEP_0178454456 /NCGR_PEP_ID=MMETSP0689_2-20121128/45369_1 /TAXON_ID=160604 /ORGANISM="Amphidinium massartii, Strain CS-259" /LENGTH=890 /DNA_ID=CAMNT_0020080393 /DNA_START=92 /DNA_END=2764 /DNA_ORIENTATION=+
MAFTDTVVEFLSLASFEVLLFLLAALVYIGFSGLLVAPRAGKQKGAGGYPVPAKQEVPSQEKEQALKSLRQGKVADAVALLQLCNHASLEEVGPRLLLAAVKSLPLEEAASLLQSLPERIPATALQAALLDAAAARKDSQAVCEGLAHLAELLSIERTAGVLTAMAKAFGSDLERLQAIVAEAPVPLPVPLAKAVLGACAQAKDVDLVYQVFNKVAEADARMLRSFAEKAAAASPTGDAKEVGKHCKAIKARGKAGDLIAATSTFDRLVKAGKGSNSMLYQAVIEACVDCKSLIKAEAYFADAMAANLADGNIASALIKAYLLEGEISGADQILVKLAASGTTVAQACYHSVLNAKVSSSGHGVADVWRTVQLMRDSGMKPTPVTCSILLKGAPNSTDPGAHIERVMSLMSDMEEAMDDVLLSSLVDVCVRAGRLHLLRSMMTTLQEEGRWVLTAPAYGSMIKAYGHVHNMEEVWWLWNDMRKRGVLPTAITLGCMVESLVSNWQTEAAWRLVRELSAEEATKEIVNVVTYSTMLKGLAHDPTKMMSMYDEMKAQGIECNAITYNTMLNCFAQSGAMHRVPGLLEDMKSCSPPVEPDMITISTLIKGYSTSGDIEKAMGLFEAMKKENKFTPDEVMYNSLLNGCARHQRITEALWLVDDMKSAGVVPSNYTLSMLVKLLGRCKRLGQAFNIIDSISKEFGFKANIQVYTCLIQACFQNRQPLKAVAVLDTILGEGLRPDEKTFSALVRGCLQASQLGRALEMAKRSYSEAGAPGVEPAVFDELVCKLGRDSAESAELSQLASRKTARGGGSSAFAAGRPSQRFGGGGGRHAVQKPAESTTTAPWCKDRQKAQQQRGLPQKAAASKKEWDAESLSTATAGTRSPSASSSEH